MNRGNGKRPIFESLADVECFLHLVELAVLAKKIALLAFSIMTTHYHLLLESLDGELPATMQRIQSLFARYLNRTRDKDGSVFRGRYRSKRVTKPGHFRACVWYIDRNPVEAGLVTSPEEYEYGSARYYVAPAGPIWLARTRVEKTICGMTGTPDYDPKGYIGALSGRANAGLSELMTMALESSDPTPLKDLEDLFGAAKPHVQDWLRRNAANADGCAAGVLVASPTSIQASIREAARDCPDRGISVGGRRRRLWATLEAGFLQLLSGLSLRQVGERQCVTASTAQARLKLHRRAIKESEEYLSVASDIARECFGRDLGELLG